MKTAGEKNSSAAGEFEELALPLMNPLYADEIALLRSLGPR